MSDTKFDLDSILSTYHETFAPLLRAQQETLKTIERLARNQFAVAGDYLDWSTAQVRVGVNAKTASDGAALQSEINSRLSDKLRARAEEFKQIATESQGALSQWFEKTSDEVVKKARKAA